MNDFISICLLYFTNCIYCDLWWYDFLSSEKTNNCNPSIISLLCTLFLDHYFLSFQVILSIILNLSKFYACAPEAEHGWRKTQPRWLLLLCIRAKNLKVDPEFCSAVIEHFPGLLILHLSVRFSHLFLSQTEYFPCGRPFQPTPLLPSPLRILKCSKENFLRFQHHIDQPTNTCTCS